MTLRNDIDDAPALAPAPAYDGPLAPPAPVTAVVVDPHAVVREGLGRLLRLEGVDVVAAGATGDAGQLLVERHQPDVALVALDLPDVHGIVLLRRLVAGGGRTAVVLYADDEDPQQSAVAVHAGAAGVVATRRSIAELATALRAVASGRMWFDELAAPEPRRRPTSELLADLRNRRAGSLSESELRVLELVARGRSTEEIATLLSLSPHTVRTHLRNLMRKLHASSRAHAVAIAIREAAIEL